MMMQESDSNRSRQSSNLMWENEEVSEEVRIEEGSGRL